MPADVAVASYYQDGDGPQRNLHTDTTNTDCCLIIINLLPPLPPPLSRTAKYYCELCAKYLILNDQLLEGNTGWWLVEGGRRNDIQLVAAVVAPCLIPSSSHLTGRQREEKLEPGCSRQWTVSGQPSCLPSLG